MYGKNESCFWSRRGGEGVDEMKLGSLHGDLGGMKDSWYFPRFGDGEGCVAA